VQGLTFNDDEAGSTNRKPYFRVGYKTQTKLCPVFYLYLQTILKILKSLND